MGNNGLPLNIPKRGLNRMEAAEYVGLSPNTFDSAVGEGLFPGPLNVGRRKVWDRKAMDWALDRLSGMSQPEWGGYDPDEEFGFGFGAST